MLTLITFFLSSCFTGCKEIRDETYYNNLLKKLVNVNSETSNIKGIAQCQNILKNEFKKIGFINTTFNLNNDRKLLIFDSANNTTPKIIMLGHIDTVQKANNNFTKFEIVGDKFIGPALWI